mgnify:CR=1 FL=1
MSDYFELVSSRESCRNYNPDRRPTREQLVKCIQTAQLAPSACNSQPWSYIVVNDPEKSPLVAAATQTAGLNKFTNNCPAFVIVCEEDAYLIGGKEPNQKYAHIDIGLSVSQLCYAATQQGLSTCIMGSFDQKMLLDSLGITSRLHYPIAGYPYDIDHIVSDEGYGKNEFVETSRPLVVVTAPGPGSGKMATCLSQLYHEHKRGVAAGYAKYETFPIWNLPLKHPVNVAYEAATVDLDDANIIDPFHLEAYGQTTVNYNRDVEIFPVLKAMMERISGSSPYQSPTDMGVNMAGNAIVDDEAVREAAKMEIVRRYFQTAVEVKRTGVGHERVEKLELLMNQAGVNASLSPARSAALLKEEMTGRPAGAMVLPNGAVVTGKTSTLLGAASSLLMNALKGVAGVDDGIDVISDDAIEPICRLKTERLHSKNPRLHSDETLIALSISSATDPLAAQLIEHVDDLRGCDAFFSVIISSTDEKLYRTLGINVCCEPKYEQHRYYHK